MRHAAARGILKDHGCVRLAAWRRCKFWAGLHVRNVQPIQTASAVAAIVEMERLWHRVRQRAHTGAEAAEERPADSSDASSSFCCGIGIRSWCDVGHPDKGGGSSPMQDQLNVQHIQATDFGVSAFAANLDSAAVATWSDPGYGGDSSQVQLQLVNVQHIQATTRAFLAICFSADAVCKGVAFSQFAF